MEKQNQQLQKQLFASLFCTPLHQISSKMLLLIKKKKCLACTHPKLQQEYSASCVTLRRAVDTVLEKGLICHSVTNLKPMETWALTQQFHYNTPHLKQQKLCCVREREHQDQFLDVLCSQGLLYSLLVSHFTEP